MLKWRHEEHSRGREGFCEPWKCFSKTLLLFLSIGTFLEKMSLEQQIQGHTVFLTVSISRFFIMPNVLCLENSVVFGGSCFGIRTRVSGLETSSLTSVPTSGFPLQCRRQQTTFVHIDRF